MSARRLAVRAAERMAQNRKKPSTGVVASRGWVRKGSGGDRNRNLADLAKSLGSQVRSPKTRATGERSHDDDRKELQIQVRPTVQRAPTPRALVPGGRKGTPYAAPKERCATRPARGFHAERPCVLRPWRLVSHRLAAEEPAHVHCLRRRGVLHSQTEHSGVDAARWR